MNPLESNENKIAGFIYKAQILQESVANLSKERAQKSELSFESISQFLAITSLFVASLP